MGHEVTILISRSLENDLLSACRLRLPYETCGIIYGTESDKRITAEGYRFIRNASSSQADTFSFHPEDWVSTYFQAQKNQRKIVGFFHTHPQGTVLPSRLDEQGSIPWGTYWIISFAADHSELAAYQRVSPQQWANLLIKRTP
jgi:proteasome lid subunit RPN8/RPN11